MADSNDSVAVFGKVATIYGVPALISAFIFQSDIAALGGLEHALLWMSVMGTTAALVLAFEIDLPTWARGIVGGLALGLMAWSFAQIARPSWESADANKRRCLAVQRDMLSAHPRRSDSPDLFQALGCRPQGEGSVYAPPRLITK